MILTLIALTATVIITKEIIKAIYNSDSSLGKGLSLAFMAVYFVISSGVSFITNIISLVCSFNLKKSEDEKIRNLFQKFFYIFLGILVFCIILAFSVLLFVL